MDIKSLGANKDAAPFDKYCSRSFAPVSLIVGC